MLSVFVVNADHDAIDTNPGDGVAEDSVGWTTLRAAVMEANALPGDDTIVLPSGTYVLDIMALYENWTGYGDLDVTSNISIIGSDAETTIIDASSLHGRVFDLPYGNYDLQLEHLTITGGMAQGDSSHTDEDDGGAIRMDFYTSVTITDCRIANVA